MGCSPDVAASGTEYVVVVPDLAGVDMTTVRVRGDEGMVVVRPRCRLEPAKWQGSPRW